MKSAIASRAREAIDLFSFPDSSSNDLRRSDVIGKDTRASNCRVR